MILSKTETIDLKKDQIAEIGIEIKGKMNV